MGGWGADPVAVGVCDRRGTVAVTGDPERRYAWASVTKLVTSLAVLVAVEEGTVRLDDQVGPEGSTLAHLLAHASGLSPDDASLVLAKPATRRIYSNAGFEVAGSHLERCSGLTTEEYVRTGVIEPLGLRSAYLAGSPAHGGHGSLSDLLALAGELLEPTLVDPSMLEGATTVAFPGLSGVLPGFGRQDPCDFGLGFELRDHKDPHWTGHLCSPSTFGHFGQSGSFLWVDPVVGIACAGLCDRPFGPWAAQAWPTLANDVLRELAGSGTEGDPHS